MEWYKKLTQGLISGIQDTDKLSFAGAMGVGPWLVPLAPAIIFGWALYESVPKTMTGDLAIIAGVAAAIGLVIAGAVSSHNAISLQSSGVGGWNLTFAWLLVFGYIGLEIIGLLTMAITSNMKAVGVVISLLTLIVYLSRSVATGLVEMKQDKEQGKQLEREDDLTGKAHQREMEKLRLQMEQAERLAKIEANKEKAIAKVSQPTVSELSQGETVLPQNDQKARILDILETNPDTPMTQIAKQNGMSRSTLYRRLDELKSEGKIKANGAGYIVTNGNN